jgi:hypothetical protein
MEGLKSDLTEECILSGDSCTQHDILVKTEADTTFNIGSLKKGSTNRRTKKKTKRYQW